MTPTRSRSWTIIEEIMAKKSAKLPPIHPGETLREDFLEPLGLSANRLAIELHVPVTRINDIAHGRRSITADTALRLSRYFGTSPQFWINLQTNYDIEVALDASAVLIDISGETAPGCLIRCGGTETACDWPLTQRFRTPRRPQLSAPWPVRPRTKRGSRPPSCLRRPHVRLSPPGWRGMPVKCRRPEV